MFGIPAVAMMLELTKEPINSYLEMSISDLLQFLFLFVGIPGFTVSLFSFVLTIIPGAMGGALLAIWFASLIPQFKSEIRTTVGVLIGGAVGGVTALLISIFTAVVLLGGPLYLDIGVLMLTLLGCASAIFSGSLVGWRLAARC
jgi:hypothetical protein